MSAFIGEFLKVPQEKGDDVELFVFGDEHYVRYENKDNYSAVYDMNLGLFTYAKIIEGEFISTGVPITDRPPENIEKNLKESKEVRRAKADRRFAKMGPKNPEG